MQLSNALQLKASLEKLQNMQISISEQNYDELSAKQKELMSAIEAAIDKMIESV